MTTQDVFISHARSMIGVPWRHRGRKPWAVDCLGLLVLSLRAAGLEPKDKLDYSRHPWKAGLKKSLMEHFGKPVSDMRPGDVALMRWPEHPEPAHVAIVGEIGGRLTLIHAYNRGAICAVVEQHVTAEWKSLINEVYRPWQ